MTLPFENDTTEIIRKIVSAQLKHDKLKKYLSIFAISLTTFLMTAVLLLVSGIIEVNTNGGNSITGSYHALVSGLTKQQYEKLSTDERIEKLGFNALVKSAPYVYRTYPKRWCACVDRSRCLHAVDYDCIGVCCTCWKWRCSACFDIYR